LWGWLPWLLVGGGAARFAGQDPPRVRWVRGDGREMQVRGGVAAADDFLPVRQHVQVGGVAARADRQRACRCWSPARQQDGAAGWPVAVAEQPH